MKKIFLITLLISTCTAHLHGMHGGLTTALRTLAVVTRPEQRALFAAVRAQSTTLEQDVAKITAYEKEEKIKKLEQELAKRTDLSHPYVNLKVNLAILMGGYYLYDLKTALAVLGASGVSASCIRALQIVRDTFLQELLEDKQKTPLVRFEIWKGNYIEKTPSTVTKSLGDAPQEDYLDARIQKLEQTLSMSKKPFPVLFGIVLQGGIIGGSYLATRDITSALAFSGLTLTTLTALGTLRTKINEHA